ncbi:UNC5C (predicted) [Pycnogonum litorale]
MIAMNLCIIYSLWTLNTVSGDDYYSTPSSMSVEDEAPQLPIFMEEPKDSFVIRNKPATLTCRVEHALKVYFKCNNDWVRTKHHSQHQYVDPMTGFRQMEVKVDVTRSDVEEYFSLDGFGCRCHAWSSYGEVNSTRAVVKISYLRKYFHNHPLNNQVPVNSQVSLSCLPPDGVPDPHVFWLKNGKILDTKQDQNFIISSEGNLIISQARLSDMGNYTCGAQNIASRRLSSTASLVVYVDGVWTSWGQWSECDSRCGRGLKQRIRQCLNPNGRRKVVTRCEGDSTQTIECHTICKRVNGRWSPWSSWSTCGPDCEQQKRRTCTNPKPSNGGKYCNGRNLIITNCTGGMCGGLSRRKAMENGVATPVGSKVLADVGTGDASGPDLVLYMAIFCAVTVFIIILIIVVVIMVKKKGRDQTIYTLPMNEMRRFYTNVNPEVHVGDPLVISSDLNCNEKNGQRKECPSPLYSVPYETDSHMINAPLIQNMSSVSSREKMMPESATSEDCSTASTQYESQPVSEYDSDCKYSPSKRQQNFIKSKIIDKSGSKINLATCGVSLTIPELAVVKCPSRIYASVLTSDQNRPILSSNETLLSPIVELGPSDVSVNKPVILVIPHCADMVDGKWKFSIYQDSSSSSSNPHWEKVCNIGEETINTPVYCQVDTKYCYVMTETLSRVVLVGRSTNKAKAVKLLKMLVFAPTVKSLMDFSIRVYCVQDTPAAVQNVLQQEKTLNGKMVAKVSTMKLVDNLSPLCISLTSLTFGWKIKPTAVYQEIPFCHIWNGSQNNLYCSFSMEQVEAPINHLGCNILVHQRDDRLSAVQLCVQTEIDEEMHIYKEIEPTNDDIMNYAADTLNFCKKETLRLGSSARKQICIALDEPNAKGRDWRLLAKHLQVDRYINYFATKLSPTEHILDLWEARNIDETGINDLANILRLMGRSDAVSHLEQMTAR